MWTQVTALGALVFAVGCAEQSVQVGRSQQAIIECNSTTVGQPCDTDDTVCTVEMCTQVGANVECLLIGNQDDGTICESDGQPCTADRCNAAGECAHDQLPQGTICSDGLFCTSGETCDAAGVCGTGTPTCEDGNDCTMDVCDEAANTCDNPPLTGQACEDGNACTEGETCTAGGACVGGAPRDCDDGNDCTNDSCSVVAGCLNVAASAGSPCEDGLFCSANDVCDGTGSCTAGGPNCLDGNACTADSCDEITRSCQNDVLPGNACDDQNACTSGDQCNGSGNCVGAPIAEGMPCTNAGGCELAGTCTAGVCGGTTPAPDGTSCDDGDACTETDECTGGVCGGPATTCSDDDDCTIDGCEPTSGCVFQPIQGCFGDPDAGVTADAGAADAQTNDAPVSGFAGDLGGGGGCSSTPSPGGGLVLLLALMLGGLVVRRRASATVIAGVCVLVSLSSNASGQSFDAEIFRPATSSNGLFSQDTADVLDRNVFNLALTFSASQDPLVMRDPASGDVLMNGSVVSSRVGAHLLAGVGLFGRLELGLDVPLTVSQEGELDLIRPGDSLGGTGLGDLRAMAKARLLGNGGVRLALATTLILPTGDADNFSGGRTAAFEPKLVLALHSGSLAVALNAGYRVRGKSQVANLIVDDEVSAGLGVRLAVVPRQLWLMAEGYVIAGVQGDGEEREMPAEVIVGGRYAVNSDWHLQAGVGFGVTKGYGAPTFRGVFSFAYAPQKPAPKRLVPIKKVIVKKPPPPKPEPPKDSDGDGIFDNEDKCPDKPEDADKWQDEDGCPDPDNDGDKIADKDDQCPNQAEVVNGIKDKDGCPDKGLIVLIKDRIILEERVLFDKQRARVKSRARPVLRAIIKLWKQNPKWKSMVIEGHADQRGSAAFNQWLSEERAKNVKKALVRFGFPNGDVITPKGFGKTKPRDTRRSKRAHQRNRRVEFVIFADGKKKIIDPTKVKVPKDAEVITP